MDTNIEVTKNVYDSIKLAFAGLIFHRHFEGKYYIRIVMPSWYKPITNYINSLK